METLPNGKLGSTILAERRTVRKGAPGFGAAQRTLAREHRSGTYRILDGRAGGLSAILLVGSERG